MSRLVAAMMRTLTCRGFVEPNRSKLAFLKDPEQLALQIKRKLSDLIEKERRSVGNFESADHLGQGARVSAFFAAEQLAFDQRGRKRSAVDRHQRPVFPQTHAVDGPGQQFFSCSGFPQEENRRVCSGNLLRLAQDLLHRNALPHDVRMLNQEFDLLLQIDILFFESFFELFDLPKVLLELLLHRRLRLRARWQTLAR